MSDTPVLGLPEIAEGVASQTVLHNEALRMLEARTVRALSRTTAAPPGSPAEGDSYIVAAGATGAWAGHDGAIASYIGGAWDYYTPVEGLALWVNDDDETVVYDGAAWAPQSSGTGVVFTEDAEPASTIDGNQWFESDTGNLYMRYQNPDSTYTWIQTNAGSAGQSPPGSVNAIINGDMMIWQRGTTWTPMTSGLYGADRWVYANAGAARHTVSRATSVPTVAQAGRLFNYALSMNCTVVNASPAAGDFSCMQQFIEGYNWVPCAQRACTLSFWVSATKTGVYSIAVFNTAADRSFVAEYTINASAVWEFKTIAIPPSPSAGTWNYTNGKGLAVTWTLAAGTTYRGPAGSWQTGLFLAGSNQVNATDAVNNSFYITGVDLRPGTFTAPQFVSRSFGEELQLCQRYFEKTFRLDTAPAAGTGFSSGDAILGKGYTTTGSTAEPYYSWRFATVKRAAPSVTLYNVRAGGASGQWSDNSNTLDSTGARVILTNEGGATFENSGQLLAAGNQWGIAATAEAEL